MGSIQLVIPKKKEPPALHDRAMDNLQYIRETMERASAFTGIPGWGQVAIGVTALASSFIAAQQKSFTNWLARQSVWHLISTCQQECFFSSHASESMPADGLIDL